QGGVPRLTSWDHPLFRVVLTRTVVGILSEQQTQTQTQRSRAEAPPVPSSPNASASASMPGGCYQMSPARHGERQTQGGLSTQTQPLDMTGSDGIAPPSQTPQTLSHTSMAVAMQRARDNAPAHALSTEDIEGLEKEVTEYLTQRASTAGGMPMHPTFSHRLSSLLHSAPATVIRQGFYSGQTPVVPLFSHIEIGVLRLPQGLNTRTMLQTITSHPLLCRPGPKDQLDPHCAFSLMYTPPSASVSRGGQREEGVVTGMVARLARTDAEYIVSQHRASESERGVPVSDSVMSSMGWQGVEPSLVDWCHSNLLPKQSHEKRETINMDPHIRHAVKMSLTYVFVWLGLSIILLWSNWLEAFWNGFQSMNPLGVFKGEETVYPDTSPCGAFAMLLPVCYWIGELALCIAMRFTINGKQREGEGEREGEVMPDVVEEVPEEPVERGEEREADAETDAEERESVSTLSLFRVAVVASIVVCVALSLASAFLTYPVERGVTHHFQREAVARGYSIDIIEDADDIEDLPWVTLNDGKGNKFWDHIEAMLYSELCAPIMGLFPYTVSGLAGTAIGMYVGLLYATANAPSLNKSVRHHFNKLYWIAAILYAVGGVWALVSDSPGSFQGSMFLGQMGLIDGKGESLMFHTGNYELFLCAMELVVVIFVIDRVDLRKTQEEKDALAAKTLWLRRLGTYSLSCFVYDDIYFGLLQLLASVFNPTCLNDNGHLTECQGITAMFYFLIVGMATVFGLMHVFDLSLGTLSIDYPLSAITGLGAHIVERVVWVYDMIWWKRRQGKGGEAEGDEGTEDPRPKIGGPTLYKRVRPGMDKNHNNITVLSLVAKDPDQEEGGKAGTTV
ncbi:hypothetical protein KIPB_004635, partial [Kipferlia bialata]